MMVKELIECLKECDPNAWVHMHLLNIHTAEEDKEITDHVRTYEIDSEGKVILYRSIFEDERC